MKSCHRCNATWDGPGQPGFNNTCSKCGMALHACINCQHFVSRGSVRCLIPEADDVLDPKGANRCGSFEFAFNSATSATTPFLDPRAPQAPHSDAASARRKWNELFGEA